MARQKRQHDTQVRISGIAPILLDELNSLIAKSFARKICANENYSISLATTTWQIFNIYIYSNFFFLQPTTGKLFKVDTIGGSLQEVLPRDSSTSLAPSCHAIALKFTGKSIAIATNHTVLSIVSVLPTDQNDETWAHAVTSSYKMDLGEGETAVAVTMREDMDVYVLMKSKKGYRIEDAPLGGPIIWFICSFIIVLGFLLYLSYSLLCGKHRVQFCSSYNPF